MTKKGWTAILCLIAVSLCVLGPSIFLQYRASKSFSVRLSMNSSFVCQLDPKKPKNVFKGLEKSNLKFSFHYHSRHSNKKSRLDDLKREYFKRLFKVKSEDYFTSLLFENPYRNGELYMLGKYSEYATRDALEKRFNLACTKTHRGLMDLSTERHFIEL